MSPNARAGSRSGFPPTAYLRLASASIRSSPCVRRVGGTYRSAVSSGRRVQSSDYADSRRNLWRSTQVHYAWRCRIRRTTPTASRSIPNVTRRPYAKTPEPWPARLLCRAPLPRTRERDRSKTSGIPYGTRHWRDGRVVECGGLENR